MPFPDFQADRKKILFFSRGKGRGHAIPDIQIVQELRALRQDVDLRFVSYATGARTIEEFQLPLIDVGLPETGALAEMNVAAGRLIGGLKPDLVVSHEEFTVLTAAKIFRRKTVFITDWFEEHDRFTMHTLKFADDILFIGHPGVFEEPAWLKERIRYVGPVLRDFQYTRDDRERARRELRIPMEAMVISVFPGSWTEEQAPILELVHDAYELLQNPIKRLIWLAGDEYELIARRFEGREDVRVIRHDWTIDRLMAATDVALTKANRKTVLELEHLGVPSIALSFGLNPIDDKVTGLSKHVSFNRAAGLRGRELSEQVEAALHAPAVAAIESPRGAFFVAERISQHLG